MSPVEAARIESTIQELEIRVMAKVGKWALTILVTCIIIGASAGAQWFSILSRTNELEKWKQTEDINDQVESKLRTEQAIVLEGRLRTIEVNQITTSRLLERVEVKLDKVLTK